MRFALIVSIETKNAGPVMDMDRGDLMDILTVAFERDGFEALRGLDWIIDFDVDWTDDPHTSDFVSKCPHGNKGPWAARECGCRLLTVPYSEVAMHMKVAGRTMWVEPVNERMVQLYDLSRTKFSAPITWGEAGYNRL